jgi:hypothetical protein
MSRRFFRLTWNALFLLLVLPRLAMAQGYWEVRDTYTNQIVYPNGVVSMFEDIAYPTVAQRVYRIANVSSFQLQISPCSITGDPSFVIGANTTSGTVYPGLATSVAIQHLPSGVGTQSATVMCQATGGYITFQVSGRVLDPSPYIVLDTLAGQNIPKSSTFDFGSTQAGTPVDRDFRITNLGNQTMTLSLSASGPYSVVTPPPSTLAKGASATFRLRLLSSVTGIASGQLSIANNDPNDNPYSVFLTGSVSAPLAPQIRITDNGNGGALVTKGSTVNFGNVPINTTATRTFTLTNTGNATLTISNPTTFVTGAGFAVWSSPTNTLGAGSNTLFTISFRSGASGTYTGTASLASNDPDDNPFPFNLQATVPVAVNTPVVTLTASDPEASETSPNGGQFTLTRSGSTSMPLTVYLNTSGTAANGTDYSAISTTQTFAAGQSTLTLPVTPIDDATIEDLETVTLALASNPAYLIGSSGSATVSIANNDFTPCTPSATVLCLQGGRFEATLTAVANGATYTGQTLSLGDASGGFWLFSPANLEVGVKVLDGAAVNGKFWIYHGAATDVAYTLTVRDRANVSRTRTFTKAAGGYCGGADTGFFTKSRLRPGKPGTEQLAAFTCVANSTTTCLLGNRFQVRVKRGTVYQQVIPVTSQTAFFSFFAPDNLEIFVKVLDGTGLNGKYWVFFGSMTDQTYTVEVTDSVTGLVKNYPNGAAFCGNADTSAF